MAMALSVWPLDDGGVDDNMAKMWYRRLLLTTIGLDDTEYVLNKHSPLSTTLAHALSNMLSTELAFFGWLIIYFSGLRS